MELFVIALALVVIMALSVWGFFELGPILTEYYGMTPNWGELGSFLGGVLAPLFSVIVLLAIVRLLKNQQRYFEGMMSANKSLDMMRYLAKVDEEIVNLLQRDIKLNDQRIAQFGDFVDGLIDTDQQQDKSFKLAMDKLLKLTTRYSEAIDNYQATAVDEHTFLIHQQRAKELVEYLEKHPEALNPMSRQAISYCKMHLHTRAA